MSLSEKSQLSFHINVSGMLMYIKNESADVNKKRVGDHFLDDIRMQRMESKKTNQ